MIHPRTFLAEFTVPAVEAWRANQSEKHLAVHAIAQLDILAEVVANWTLSAGRPKLDRGEAGAFRDALGAREPILADIRDAHDSHKHGILDRRSKVVVTQGQRPDTVTRYGQFFDVTFFDGPLTPYSVVVLQKDDGSEIEIFALL